MSANQTLKVNAHLGILLPLRNTKATKNKTRKIFIDCLFITTCLVNMREKNLISGYMILELGKINNEL